MSLPIVFWRMAFLVSLCIVIHQTLKRKINLCTSIQGRHSEATMPPFASFLDNEGSSRGRHRHSPLQLHLSPPPLLPLGVVVDAAPSLPEGEVINKNTLSDEGIAMQHIIRLGQEQPVDLYWGLMEKYEEEHKRMLKFRDVA